MKSKILENIVFCDNFHLLIFNCFLYEENGSFLRPISVDTFAVLETLSNDYQNKDLTHVLRIFL